jgi:cell wall-associated NlpC family hydrolase
MQFKKTIGTLALAGCAALLGPAFTHVSTQPSTQASTASTQTSPQPQPVAVTFHHSLNDYPLNDALRVRPVPVSKLTAPESKESSTHSRPTSHDANHYSVSRVNTHTKQKPLSSRSGFVTHLPLSYIVGTAEKYIGVPYHWGGTSPSTGFDCSGFVQYVFSLHGKYLPRTASAMYYATSPVRYPLPGDLVFFNTYGGVSHVGIYVGGGRFISAAGRGVRIDSLQDSYWSARYLGARRA